MPQYMEMAISRTINELPSYIGKYHSEIMINMQQCLEPKESIDGLTKVHQIVNSYRDVNKNEVESDAPLRQIHKHVAHMSSMPNVQRNNMHQQLQSIIMNTVRRYRHPRSQDETQNISSRLTHNWGDITAGFVSYVHCYDQTRQILLSWRDRLSQEKESIDVWNPIFKLRLNTFEFASLYQMPESKLSELSQEQRLKHITQKERNNTEYLPIRNNNSANRDALIFHDRDWTLLKQSSQYINNKFYNSAAKNIANTMQSELHLDLYFDRTVQCVTLARIEDGTGTNTNNRRINGNDNKNSNGIDSRDSLTPYSEKNFD